MDVKSIEGKLNEMNRKINSLELRLEDKACKTKEIYLNNQELIRLLKISKRTAQEWRDTGIIPYSQIKGKIYYRLSDVEKLIVNNLQNTKKDE